MDPQLEKAINNGDIPSIESLIKSDQKILNANALFYAVRHGSAAVVDVLVSKGAKVDVSAEGVSLLEACYERSDISIFKVLLKHQITLKKVGNATTKHRNALHGLYRVKPSAMKDFYEAISDRKAMMEASDFTNFDRDGYFPIHYACIHDSAIMSSLLLSDGCPLVETRYSKLSPVELCVIYGSLSVLQTLVHTIKDNERERHPWLENILIKPQTDLKNGLLHDLEITDDLKKPEGMVPKLMALFAATSNILYKDVLVSLMAVFMKQTVKVVDATVKAEAKQRFDQLKPQDKRDLVTLLKAKPDDFDKNEGDETSVTKSANEGIVVYETFNDKKDKVLSERHISSLRYLYSVFLAYAKVCGFADLAQKESTAKTTSAWAAKGLSSLPEATLKDLRRPAIFELECNKGILNPSAAPATTTEATPQPAAKPAAAAAAPATTAAPAAPAAQSADMSKDATAAIAVAKAEAETARKAHEASEKQRVDLDKKLKDALAEKESLLKKYTALEFQQEEKLAAAARGQQKKIQELTQKVTELETKLSTAQKAKTEFEKANKELQKEVKTLTDKLNAKGKADAKEEDDLKKRIAEFEIKEKEMKERATIAPQHNYHTTCDHTCPHMYDAEALAMAFADASWDHVARMLGKLVMYAADQKKKRAEQEKNMIAMSNMNAETKQHNVGSGSAHLNYLILPEPLEKITSTAIKAYVNTFASAKVLGTRSGYFTIPTADLSRGKSLLAMALGGGAPTRIIHILLSLGADYAATDDLGFTPVRWGIERLFSGARGTCRAMGIRHDEKHLPDRASYVKMPKSQYFLKFPAMDVDYALFREHLAELVRVSKGMLTSAQTSPIQPTLGSALDRALDFNFNTAKDLYKNMGFMEFPKSVFVSRNGQDSLQPSAGVLEAQYKGVARPPIEELAWADAMPPIVAPLAIPTAMVSPPPSSTTRGVAAKPTGTTPVFDFANWARDLVASRGKSLQIPSELEALLQDPIIAANAAVNMDFTTFVQSRQAEMQGVTFNTPADEDFKLQARDGMRGMCAQHAASFGGMEEFYLTFNVTYLNNYRHWFQYCSSALNVLQSWKSILADPKDVKLPTTAQENLRHACSICFSNVATIMCSDCKKVIYCGDCSGYHNCCTNCRSSSCELVPVKM